MNFVLQPWHLLLVILAGWINQQQQEVIESLRTENQVLKEAHGKKPIRLTDDQRRRLAVKGEVLGRKVLEEIATIFTPDTILRWHRQLVAQKWDYSHRRGKVGRPRVSSEIAKLVLRMARENPTWGYDRIQGALANLGHRISDTTVGNILREHGIDPVPERKRQTTWKTFLKSHWDVLGVVDFTTTEVWSKGGLVTFYLLFVIEVATGRVHFAGCATSPHAAWMKRVGRNLTDSLDGSLLGTRYLLMDRDTTFCEAFLSILEQADVTPVRLPARSPNLNAHIERFHRSLKQECLDRMIFFGERSVRMAVWQFLEHDHRERNHQGLGNRLIQPEVGRTSGDVSCRERLGGLLQYDYRDAAEVGPNAHPGRRMASSESPRIPVRVSAWAREWPEAKALEQLRACLSFLTLRGRPFLVADGSPLHFSLCTLHQRGICGECHSPSARNYEGCSVIRPASRTNSLACAIKVLVSSGVMSASTP